MHEWQTGILSGVLATISFILLDSFFALPYLYEMVISFVFTLTGTLVVGKLLNDRRKRSRREA
ncbi:hypothetical protein [Marinococcus sp. PL1-022]|uniref:hypothetical protein n=1 Tax=Marinococcus sp. PL1-022 TaxID=3095363 RepID=UPI0029C3B057|nr:hypothetical protein [Marinococcus sp. PL1-022]MDX6154521.1 hypothetical protein [Marinococcus sp. PL1-022]